MARFGRGEIILPRQREIMREQSNHDNDLGGCPEHPTLLPGVVSVGAPNQSTAELTPRKNRCRTRRTEGWRTEGERRGERRA